jgi:hypothetical protein
MERLMIRVGRLSIEPRAAAAVRWLVAPDDRATVSPTVSKTVRAPALGERTIDTKMLDDWGGLAVISAPSISYSVRSSSSRQLSRRSSNRTTDRRGDGPGTAIQNVSAQISSSDFAGARYRRLDDDREVQRPLTTVAYTDHQTAHSPAAGVNVGTSSRMISAREPREYIRPPLPSGFSCRLHGLYLLISDPFLGSFLGMEPGHDLQMTARGLGFHLEGLASIRVWDNSINCHGANMA